MKRLVLAFLLLPSAAMAQSSIDINLANFYWDWAQGTGGAVAEFRIKCGPAVGNYPTVTIVANPAARNFPVKNAVSGQGTWHCIMTAANQYGESPPTGDVFFAAGVSASSPSNFRLTP